MRRGRRGLLPGGPESGLARLAVMIAMVSREGRNRRLRVAVGRISPASCQHYGRERPSFGQRDRFDCLPAAVRGRCGRGHRRAPSPSSRAWALRCMTGLRDASGRDVTPGGLRWIGRAFAGPSSPAIGGGKVGNETEMDIPSHSMALLAAARTATASTWFFETAQSMGILPASSLASRSAPAARSASMASMSPFQAA